MWAREKLAVLADEGGRTYYMLEPGMHDICWNRWPPSNFRCVRRLRGFETNSFYFPPPLALDLAKTSACAPPDPPVLTVRSPYLHLVR